MRLYVSRRRILWMGAWPCRMLHSKMLLHGERQPRKSLRPLSTISTACSTGTTRSRKPCKRSMISFGCGITWLEYRCLRTWNKRRRKSLRRVESAFGRKTHRERLLPTLVWNTFVRQAHRLVVPSFSRGLKMTGWLLGVRTRQWFSARCCGVQKTCLRGCRAGGTGRLLICHRPQSAHRSCQTYFKAETLAPNKGRSAPRR